MDSSQRGDAPSPPPANPAVDPEQPAENANPAVPLPAQSGRSPNPAVLNPAVGPIPVPAPMATRRSLTRGYSRVTIIPNQATGLANVLRVLVPDDDAGDSAGGPAGEKVSRSSARSSAGSAIGPNAKSASCPRDPEPSSPVASTSAQSASATAEVGLLSISMKKEWVSRSAAAAEAEAAPACAAKEITQAQVAAAMKTALESATASGGSGTADVDSSGTASVAPVPHRFTLQDLLAAMPGGDVAVAGQGAEILNVCQSIAGIRLPDSQETEDDSESKEKEKPRD